MAIARPSVGGQVLSIGEILVDFIVTDGATSLEAAESFVARPGGAPANAAVALSRLGIASAFCGVAGDDPFGSRLRHELAGEGVETSALRQAGEMATTLAFAWKDERGDGHFWLLRGADTLLTPEDAANAGIGERAALVVGSVSLATQPARSAIEAAVGIAVRDDVPVVFDVNLRPSLWPDLFTALAPCLQVAERSRLVKLSLDDAQGLFGPSTSPDDAIGRILALGPQSVVLTDGERGCWFANRSNPRIAHVPAFAVDAVEPTGAGDAFTAAIVARSMASEWADLSLADVRYAAAAGAVATTKRGAWAGLPSRPQLDAFLARFDANGATARQP